MQIGLELIIGCAGMALAAVCLALILSERKRTRRERAQLEWSIERNQTGYAAETARIEAALRALEEKTRPEARPTRSLAMQKLRSGLSPETAANSLGIPVREMHLISKVSELLTDGL